MDKYPHVPMLAAFLWLASGAPCPAQQPADRVPTTVSYTVTDTPTVHRRPRAIEYSDAYYTRLTIHRIGSYTMLPLFAAEFSIGQNLLNDRTPASWMLPAHIAVATGLAGLFTINTVTGVWNLWDARKNPDRRTLRIVHSALMLASDAGFALTGALGGGSHVKTANGEIHIPNLQRRREHKTVALISMSLSTVGTGIMWLFNR